MSQIRLPWQRHKILLSNEPVMLGCFHRFSDNRTSCRCRLLVGLADLATSGWLQRSLQRIFSRRLAHKLPQNATECPHHIGHSGLSLYITGIQKCCETRQISSQRSASTNGLREITSSSAVRSFRFRKYCHIK